MINSYLTIGKIVGVHGIKGEVKVLPLTDDVRRFKKLEKCALCKNPDNPDDQFVPEIKVLSVRIDNETALIKFEGYEDRTIAERLRNLYISVSRDDAVKTNKDEYFIVDLIGLKVVDDKRGEIGIISDVYENGANFIVQVKRRGKKDLLIPFLKVICYKVDFDNDSFMVNIPDDLYEIYD
ncbi:MAG: ribosome maturation factor RimM [Clostridia bacterium]|nr:ribosome maturation factor RimM [Clostridia bacterium]